METIEQIMILVLAVMMAAFGWRISGKVESAWKIEPKCEFLRSNKKRLVIKNPSINILTTLRNHPDVEIKDLANNTIEVTKKRCGREGVR